MADQFRYRHSGADFATWTRFPALLPGMVTVWEGRRATVVHVEERAEVDGGKWVVELDHGDGSKTFALSAPDPSLTLPVFRDPYPVCSCHSQPWPCDDAYALMQGRRQKQNEAWSKVRKCAACGQTKNLGKVRYLGEQTRFCRRVGCVREAERREREWHNSRTQERREAETFAQQMSSAFLGLDDPGSAGNAGSRPTTDA